MHGRARPRGFNVDTAIVSVATVCTLVPVIPRVLALRSPQELEREIKKRELTERNLQLVASELKRSNEELESFARAAAHDLMSPLRAIKGLVSFIREDAEDQLPEVCRGHIEKLEARTMRMQHLLESSLAYARVGMHEGRPEPSDWREIIQDAVQNLNVPSQVNIDVSSKGCSLDCRRVALRQVFHNLVNNAIKHHDGPKAAIAIDAHAGPEFVEFTVTDDGPGISPKYHETVLRPYATLRRKDEIEGAGMGLAIVKKAVEQRGGRLTIESDGKRGTCVRFTWPVNEPLELNHG